MARTEPPTPFSRFNQWPSLPLVSLLVAAWNEEKHLETFLNSFTDLRYPNKELILVAGGNDRTLTLARKWANQQIIIAEQIPGEGKFRALHRNLSLVNGELVVLTDADCQLTSTQVNRLIYPLVCDTAQVVNGLYCPLQTQSGEPLIWAQWARTFYYGQTLSQIQPTYLPFMAGQNSAITRSLLESCWMGVDRPPVELDYHLALSVQELGEQVLYVDFCYVHTDHHANLLRYMMQQSRWRRTMLMLNYDFGDHRWVKNFLSSIKFSLLLLLPFLPFLLGLLGIMIWTLAWAFYFRPYLQALLYLHFIEKKILSFRHLWGMFQLMIADFIAWAVVPIQICVPQWRTHWR